MGLMIKAIQNELTAVDDRTFKWVLKQPYPKMLLALGKNSTPCAFIMPERIAQTDPFKQISEYVGSGPMKFVRERMGARCARRCSKSSRTTCRGKKRTHGLPAASRCCSTASNGW